MGRVSRRSDTQDKLRIKLISADSAVKQKDSWLAHASLSLDRHKGREFRANASLAPVNRNQRSSVSPAVNCKPSQTAAGVAGWRWWGGGGGRNLF